MNQKKTFSTPSDHGPQPSSFSSHGLVVVFQSQSKICCRLIGGPLLQCYVVLFKDRGTKWPLHKYHIPFWRGIPEITGLSAGGQSNAGLGLLRMVRPGALHWGTWPGASRRAILEPWTTSCRPDRGEGREPPGVWVLEWAAAAKMAPSTGTCGDVTGRLGIILQAQGVLWTPWVGRITA